MKKRLVMFVFLLVSLFIMADNADAANCDKYGCATCTYKVNNHEVKYEVVSNGSSITVDFKTSEIEKNTVDYKFTNNVNTNSFKNGDEIVCPSNLYTTYSASGMTISLKLYDEEKDSSIKIPLMNATSNNKKITGSASSNDISTNNGSNGSNGSNSAGSSNKTCNVISEDLRLFLQDILDYVRITGIVLAVVLTIMDYIKAIFSSDDKSNSKATKRFSTRLILLALLFIIPTFIIFILNIFNIMGVGGAGTCGVY